MLLLANNSAERDRLISKGLQRVKAFDWGKTAAQTFAVYQAVVAQNSGSK